MTADRASIRRGLAVGRWPHRPPSRRRKLGHRPIVAPLLGAVALATVGVGLKLALLERDRRSLFKRRRLERTFGLLAEEQLLPGLRRIALGQLDLAIELLEHAEERNAEEAMHEIRKAIKRLRALMRVLRKELGEQTYRRENAALRDAAGHLAGARDSQVALNTLDLVLHDLSAKRARRPSIAALHAKLQRERDLETSQAFRDAGSREAALHELLAVRERLARWNPSQPASGRAQARARGGSRVRSMGTIGKGLERIYREGRQRLQTAHSSSQPTALHELRKRVKDLRYAAEMLTPQEGRSKRIRNVARAADRMGEVLGEEHDLVLLSERIQASAELFAADRKSGRLLSAAIKRRRKRLRKRALHMGDELYASRRPAI